MHAGVGSRRTAVHNVLWLVVFGFKGGHEYIINKHMCLWQTIKLLGGSCVCSTHMYHMWRDETPACWNPCADVVHTQLCAYVGRI